MARLINGLELKRPLLVGGPHPGRQLRPGQHGPRKPHGDPPQVLHSSLEGPVHHGPGGERHRTQPVEDHVRQPRRLGIFTRLHFSP